MSVPGYLLSEYNVSLNDSEKWKDSTGYSRQRLNQYLERLRLVEHLPACVMGTHFLYCVFGAIAAGLKCTRVGFLGGTALAIQNALIVSQKLLTQVRPNREQFSASWCPAYKCSRDPTGIASPPELVRISQLETNHVSLWEPFHCWCTWLLKINLSLFIFLLQSSTVSFLGTGLSLVHNHCWEYQGWNPSSPLTISVTLDVPPHLLASQFPYLQDRDNPACLAVHPENQLAQRWALRSAWWMATDQLDKALHTEAEQNLAELTMTKHGLNSGREELFMDSWTFMVSTPFPLTWAWMTVYNPLFIHGSFMTTWQSFQAHHVSWGQKNWWSDLGCGDWAHWQPQVHSYN